MEIIYKGMEETDLFFVCFLKNKPTHSWFWPTPTLCLCPGLFGSFCFTCLHCKKQKKDRKKTTCILQGYLL